MINSKLNIRRKLSISHDRFVLREKTRLVQCLLETAIGHGNSNWAWKQQLGMETAIGHGNSNWARKQQLGMETAIGHGNSNWAWKQQLVMETAIVKLDRKTE